ncbi:hypothetical protein TDB9533_02169 [Thalassocella blandensis]|nr:hypothetical protein TDB9533_02169 [Thalassocella blandensis]
MKSQKGFSMPGWILIIGFAGFLMMFVIAAAPPYIDNIYVQDALKSLVKDGQNLGQMEKNEIKRALSSYFTINRINSDAEKSFEIKKYGNRVIVNANYEVRSNLMANIDVVVKFENQLDSNNPQACCERLVTKIDENK